MSDFQAIWLEPSESVQEHDRTWCSDPDAYGGDGVKYVRADTADDLRQQLQVASAERDRYLAALEEIRERCGSDLMYAGIVRIIEQEVDGS